MRLLLDTHIALWVLADDPRLSQAARDLIADPENDKVVSAVSILEIAIKHALKRGDPQAMPISGSDAKAFFEEADFELIPVTPSHAAAVDRLPPIHKDPFDRLLVAQALHEPLKLLTHDARVAAYSDTILQV